MNTSKKSLRIILVFLLGAFSLSSQSQGTIPPPTGRLIFSDWAQGFPAYYVYDFATQEISLVTDTFEPYTDLVFLYPIDDTLVIAEVCYSFEEGRCRLSEGEVIFRDQLSRYDVISRPLWEDGFGAPNWSPDNTYITFWNIEIPESPALPIVEIYVMDADGTNICDLTPTSNEEVHSVNFAWSPDSTRLAFGCYNGMFLCIADVLTGELSQFVIRVDMSIGHVMWLPDGRILTFVRAFENLAYVYLPYTIAPDGSNLQRVIDEGIPNVVYTRLSPDGTQVALNSSSLFSSFLFQSDVQILDINSGTVIGITATDTISEERPIWSPDGEYVAFFAVNNGVTPRTGTLNIAHRDGGYTEIITENYTFQYVNLPYPALFWIP